MADSFSTSLEFRLQTVGGNNNTWGGFLNTTIQNIDTAIHGFIQVSLASADVTLSTAQGRNPIIEVTGVLPADRELIVKNSVGNYWIINSTSGSFSVTVKTSGGTGVVVPQGSSALVYCDGTNVERASGTLAGLDTVGTDEITALAVTAAKLAAEAVTLAKMAQMATDGFIGNDSGGSAVPQLLTVAEATALLNAMVADSGSGGTKGLVPAPVAGDAVKALLGDADFHLAEDIDATKSLAATGYTRLPGGLIIQWGLQENVSYNTPTSISFPLTFDTLCVGVVGNLAEDHNQAQGSSSYAISFYNKTTSGVTINSGVNEVRDYFWIALGY